MTDFLESMTDEEKARFFTLSKENIEFLLERYNKVNRWVIGGTPERRGITKPDVVQGNFSMECSVYPYFKQMP